MPRFFNNKKEKTEDSEFWESIILAELKETRKTKGVKVKPKEGVKVVIDAGEGVAAVADRKQERWMVRVPFNGTSVKGLQEKLFNSRKDKALKQEILDQYITNHKYMTEYQKSRMLKKINRNVDLKVYKILKDYDFSNYNSTNMSQEYVNAMIRNISVKNKKTDNSRRRAKNEEMARRKELEKAGITVSYELKNLVFNKNNPIDNIKVLLNALKYRKFAEVKLPGFTINPAKRKIRKVRKNEDKKAIKIKKKPKQLVPLKLKKTKKKESYKSKESLVKKFKNKVNEASWTTVVKRGLATAGIIGLAGLAGFSATNKNINTTKVNEKQIETISDNEILDFEIVGLRNNGEQKEKQEVKDKFSIQHILESNTENVSNETENQENNIEENDEKSNSIIDNDNANGKTTIQVENSDEVQNEEKVILKDALIEALGLGFDTEFSMESGRYYEAPGKTGRSGGYSNISNKIKINYVDAIENGNYYKYSIEDGKSIADIKKEHPNAQLSYHIVTNSGMVLGWNDSTENDIEINMIKGALMDMKPYIASETMEYLCANGLNGEVSSREFSEYIQELQEAQSQVKVDKQVEKSVRER